MHRIRKLGKINKQAKAVQQPPSLYGAPNQSRDFVKAGKPKNKNRRHKKMNKYLVGIEGCHFFECEWYGAQAHETVFSAWKSWFMTGKKAIVINTETGESKIFKT